MREIVVLRDFACGLALASVIAALWTLLSPDLSDDAEPVLMLTGAMLSSIGFVIGWLGSREDRCLKRELAAIDKRERRWTEAARQRALRLNAYAARLESRAAAAVGLATVIMFPSRRRTPTCALATPLLG